MTALVKWWKLGAILVLVGALVIACHERDDALRAEGAMRAKLAELTAKTHRDSVAGEVAGAIVRRDTVVLTKWLVRYDTIRHTLNIHDTIAVTRYVEVTDSTIHACREAVSSLTTLCQRKDSIIADLRRVIQIQPRTLTSGSGWKEKLSWGLGGLVVGAVVDRVAHERGR